MRIRTMTIRNRRKTIHNRLKQELFRYVFAMNQRHDKQCGIGSPDTSDKPCVLQFFVAGLQPWLCNSEQLAS